MKNTDLLLAFLYLALAFIIDLPSIRHGYDYMHHDYLLAACLRIRDGQTPFVNFFPWYGPLYYYLASLFTAPLGHNLLAVKIYLRVINPLAATFMLLIALRWLGIGWKGRLFALFANAAWGMDRIMYCGSIRAVLASFLLAAACRGLQHSRFRGLSRASLLPIGLAIFFFSPETGVYFLFAATGAIALDLFTNKATDRPAASLHYLAGAGFAAIFMAAFHLISPLPLHYLDFTAYSSANMAWAYGLPLFEEEERRGLLFDLLFLLPPVAAIIGTGWTLKHAAAKTLDPSRAWVGAFAILAGASFLTVLTRAEPWHLIFAMPPALILAARWFETRGWVGAPIKISLTILVILAAILSDPFAENNPFGRYDARYWTGKITGTPPFQDTVPFSGIFITEEEAEDWDKLMAFQNAHPGTTMAFPLRGFEYFRAGLAPEFPFDDLLWSSMPERQQALIDGLITRKPDFISLNARHLLAFYTQEDTEQLFDLIEDYYHLREVLPLHDVYEQNAHPSPPPEQIRALPDLALTPANKFTVEWHIPYAPTYGFITFRVKFKYGFPSLRRFSVPKARSLDDGNWPNQKRWVFIGRERMRTGPEGGIFRIFFSPQSRQVRFKIFFPGPFNYRPRRVEVSDIGVYWLRTPPAAPYLPDFFTVEMK